MIVADTNLLTYLLMEGPMLPLAEQVFCKDPDWTAPALWRSEFRNVLAGFMRRGQLNLESALEYWHQAETLMLSSEAETIGATVLQLAQASGCTAYDCEFVALAQKLGVPLVTADGQILKAFPGIALSPQEFLGKN
jgi:predicted nucleic acid-binding protein